MPTNINQFQELHETFLPIPDERTKISAALQRLHLNKNEHQLQSLLSSPEFSYLKKILLEMDELVEYLGEENILSPYDLKKIYRYHKFYTLAKLPPGAASRLESNANYWMESVYLTLTLIGLVVCACSLAHVNLPLFSSQHFTIFSGAAWNTSDTGGCTLIGIEQWKNGEKTLGTLNILSSLQQLGFTLPATVLYALGQICVSTATAYLGATFAVSTLASYLIEVYEIRRCDKKLELLQQKLTQVQLDDPTNEKKIRILSQAIEAEYCIRAYHERNAKAWLFCSIAMISISIVAFLALSTVTLGAVPIATVVVASVAFLSGVIRASWVNDENMARGIKMFDKNHLSHHERMKLQAPLYSRLCQVRTVFKEMDKQVEIAGFFHANWTMFNYILSLISNKPARAIKIIEALEKDKSNKDLNCSEFDKIFCNLDKGDTGLLIYHKIIQAQSFFSSTTQLSETPTEGDSDGDGDKDSSVSYERLT